jgi:hypothetical protein
VGDGEGEEVNIDQMTEQEVRDYLAECEGWKRPAYVWPNPEAFSTDCWTRRYESATGEITYSRALSHPVPATLDAAAGCLPKGLMTKVYINCDGVTIAKVFHDDAVFEAAGDIERHARFRAAAKALAVVRKESGR